MKSVSSRELMKAIRRDGWLEISAKGSHHQFRHPVKPGRVTVPHPRRDVPWKTVKSILAQAGLDENVL